MAKIEMTLSDFTESLTGFEEEAILEHFGADVNDLLQERPTMGYRALIMVHAAREPEAMKAPAARKYAMGFAMRELGEYFKSDDDEQDEHLDEHLETPSGKGEQPES